MVNYIYIVVNHIYILSLWQTYKATRHIDRVNCRLKKSVLGKEYMADFDGLKQFFGEDGTTAITYEELTRGITEKGIKLADLSLGGYVAKDKYDEQTRKFNDYKAKNDTSKYADYDTIKAELETLRTEKADREYIDKLSAKKVKAEFRKFVLAEIKSAGDSATDFDKAMEKYLKDNPQYVEAEEKKTPFFKSSSAPLDNGSGGAKNENQKMNDFLRSGFGRKGN